MLDIEAHIDKVADKFGYDDKLKQVLKRIVPIMIKGKDEEKQQMLADTLDRVKIFVLEQGFTGEDIDKCEQEIMGDKNGVKFKYQDNGEYGKTPSAGGYVSEPVFDDNMNLVDRKSFLFVSKLSEYNELSQVYGTDINVSHLIHELGHAWASQKEEYIQNEDGSVENRVGAIRQRLSVDKDSREVCEEYTEGVFIEEALNTLEEERALCELVGVESIDELTPKGYVRSNYQGFITDMMREYIGKFKQGRFDDYRFGKDNEVLEDIENALLNTEDWSTIQSSQFNVKKREKFNSIEELEVSDGAKQIIRDTFSQYDSVFFPDNSKLAPMQKLNNVFEQLYTFGIKARYNFGIVENEKNKEIYNKVALAMLAEGYVPVNQAEELQEREPKVKPKGFLSDLQSGVIPPRDQKESESLNKDNRVIEGQAKEL